MPQPPHLPRQQPQRPLVPPPDPTRPPPRIPRGQPPPADDPPGEASPADGSPGKAPPGDAPPADPPPGDAPAAEGDAPPAEPDAPPVEAEPDPPAPPGKPAPPDGAPAEAGWPRYFPSAFAWLTTGMGRSRWGVGAGLVGTYSLLPLAIYVGAISGVVAGIAGGFGGFGFVRQWLPQWVRELPLLGAALDVFLPGASGVIGAVVGALLGVALGFVGTLAGIWWRPFTEDPVAAAGSVLGWVVLGLFIGLVYTLVWVLFEPAFLRLRGARRMSRRERDLLLPIVSACVQRLGLENHPPILIDDSREPNAVAYTRHIVVNQGLLEEFQYDHQVLAGILCHELVHWRNADPVGAAFVRGIALPLYIIYNGAAWVTQRVERNRWAAFAFWLPILILKALLWPVTVTVRYVVMPLQARDTRAAEYRADQGAVLGGHRDGLRRALTRMRRTFESGRSGWDLAVCATHPPNELRLERLEDPSRQYPLPEPDRAAGQPLPARPGSSLQQD